ncbi:DUF975 family protein [Natronospora cellulosivora (SeqCode)]
MLYYISAKDFLKKGSLLFKKNFWRLFIIHLLLILFSIFLSVIFFGLSFLSLNLELNPFITSFFIFLFFLAFVLIIPVLTAGYRYIYIKIANGEKSNFLDLFKGFSNFWNVWLCQYFKTILIYAGSLLFLIPFLVILIPSIFYPLFNSLYEYSHYGVNSNYYHIENLFYNSTILISLFPIIIMIISAFWILKFMLTTYVVVDKNCSASNALYYGSKITNGYKWKIFLVLLCPFLLSFVINVILGYLGAGAILSFYDFLGMFIATFIISPWINCIIAIIYKTLLYKSSNLNEHDLEKLENKSKAPIETEQLDDDSDENLES